MNYICQQRRTINIISYTIKTITWCIDFLVHFLRRSVLIFTYWNLSFQLKNRNLHYAVLVEPMKWGLIFVRHINQEITTHRIWECEWAHGDRCTKGQIWWFYNHQDVRNSWRRREQKHARCIRIIVWDSASRRKLFTALKWKVLKARRVSSDFSFQAIRRFMLMFSTQEMGDFWLVFEPFCIFVERLQATVNRFHPNCPIFYIHIYIMYMWVAQTKISWKIFFVNILKVLVPTR